MLLLVLYAGAALLALRLALSYKSALYALRRAWRWADEWAQAYQYHEVPRFFGPDGSENPLFRKAAAYVSSLPSLEDAVAACVVSSSSGPRRAKTINGGLSLHLGPAHTARDAFLGARLAWTMTNDNERLVLRVRRHDRTRVLRPYLQHVESVADEMMDLMRRRDLRLFINTGVNSVDGLPRWAWAPFSHPATLDTVAMDGDLKARVRADLEGFLKGRAYYHRLGRVWRRSYLLYGPPGTGKSTFAAAMARFLNYDVYDIDLSRLIGDHMDLRAVLMHTTPRSLILVEDLDLYLQNESSSRVLSFMDGISSCCGEERVMVFTMRGAVAGETSKEQWAAAVMRPGRLDVHIKFTLCDFEAFKAMASSYLGIKKDHKLYPQVEEGFNNSASAGISHAEVGEIMLANRGSPTRALRSVITKLNQQQRHVASSGAVPPPPPPPPHHHHRRNGSWDEQDGATEGGDHDKEHAHAPMRELKKLYGLIKIRSRREGSGVVPFEADCHGPPTPAGNHDKER